MDIGHTSYVYLFGYISIYIYINNLDKSIGIKSFISTITLAIANVTADYLKSIVNLINRVNVISLLRNKRITS